MTRKLAEIREQGGSEIFMGIVSVLSAALLLLGCEIRF
jgi:hypothetical protein